ncbi:MAG: CPBP family intramembrane glutamic endopeptidase [Chloroflexota bacterium]
METSSPATLSEKLRTRYSIALIALTYLVLFAIAEASLDFGSPTVGFIVYIGVMLGLFVHSAATWDTPLSQFLLTVSLIPLIRIVGLSLPLATIATIYWYVLISIPLFVAVAIICIVLKLPLKAIGLTTHGLLLQFIIGLVGIAFGFVGYQIVQPVALVNSLTVQSLAVPAVILFVCTGFLEELIFRGILLYGTRKVIGAANGLYVAIMYTLLQVGQKSLALGVFTFVVALFFSWIATKTQSIIGVSIAHGLTNIMFFLIMPLVPTSTGLILTAVGLATAILLLLISVVNRRFSRT